MEINNFDSDTETLAEAARRLQENPDIMDRLATDPQGVLRELGMNVDERTAQAIQAQAQSRMQAGAAAQAAIIHADT